MSRAVIVALLLGAWGPSSFAQEGDPLPSASAEAEARSRFTLGQTHFNLHEYEAAIADFQAGYRLKPLPLFLYNVAQAARKAGKADFAIEYYQKYIGAETDNHAPELAEAARWLNQIRRRTAPVQPPVESKPPPPTPVLQPVPVASATAAAPMPHRPVWKRGWFWGTLVGVVVVVGTATATAVALTVPHSLPSTNYGPIRPLGP